MVKPKSVKEPSMSVVTWPHVELNAENVPIITGTTTKVVEVVLDHLAHHWDAHEIRRQYPYLDLAQIHSALAYYYDHQQELDEDINRRRNRVAEIKAEIGDSKLRDKLKQLGHLH
jgi:uncharacterized protein (DUF433 family)